jgi:periplasmic protein TonB
VIGREPVGARRLAFTAGAAVVYAAALWTVFRTPAPGPPVPLDVLLVPPGAVRVERVPPGRIAWSRPGGEPLASPRAAEGVAASRERVRASGPRRRTAPGRRPDRLAPAEPGTLATPSTPPLEIAIPVDAPLRGREVAFSGDGAPFFRDGVAYFSDGAGWRRGGSRRETGEGERLAGLEASEWLRLHRRDIVRRIQDRASARPYPPVAVSMGWTGLVRVAFTIRTDGTVADLRVVGSSARPVLDECAREDVLASVPLPRPPRPQAVEVPILYTLR